MPLAKAVPRNLFWHIHPLVKHEDEYARIQIPLKRIIFFSLPSAFCIFYLSPPLLLIYSKLCGYYHASKWRTSFSFIKKLALIPAWAEPLILFNSHCSVAAISSLSPSWYAQLMMPYHSLYLPNSLKDIPVLDCVVYHHRSFNLSIFILGSIKSIFTHWNFVDFGLLSLASWLASITPKDLCTVQLDEVSSCVEFSIVFDWSGRIHECECSRDGFNPVQDLQGLPASQAYLGAVNFGSHWRKKNTTLSCPW